jgi:2-methylisocitrate lyase-like PEP mutase family enzyme
MPLASKADCLIFKYGTGMSKDIDNMDSSTMAPRGMAGRRLVIAELLACIILLLSMTCPIHALQPAQRLLDMISHARQTKRAIPLLGVHDALSARILNRQSDKNVALFVSGFGVSAARLGQPDAGILTRSDLEDVTRNILQVTTHGSPVIVDGDTGFGGTPNVRQTIRRMATIGAAAISVEDQVFPKRCTYVAGSGVNVISRDESRKRIRAALAAQEEAYEQDGNRILIIARTDCRMALGLEEAIERCQVFEELGADIAYAENLQSAEEYQTLRSKISKPMMLAQVQTGSPDQTLWTFDEIGSMGYELALWGVSGLQASVAALEAAASEILEQGGLISSTPLSTLNQVKDIVGFSELDSFEDEFGCK